MVGGGCVCPFDHYHGSCGSGSRPAALHRLHRPWQRVSGRRRAPARREPTTVARGPTDALQCVGTDPLDIPLKLDAGATGEMRARDREHRSSSQMGGGKRKLWARIAGCARDLPGHRASQQRRANQTDCDLRSRCHRTSPVWHLQAPGSRLLVRPPPDKPNGLDTSSDDQMRGKRNARAVTAPLSVGARCAEPAVAAAVERAHGTQALRIRVLRPLQARGPDVASAGAAAERTAVSLLLPDRGSHDDPVRAPTQMRVSAP